MAWTVLFHLEFEPEFAELDEDVQDGLLQVIDVLGTNGPELGRPYVDTLAGSRLTNLKEIRLQTAAGPYRFAFAFDPLRQAIILCGGSKAGVSQARFYKALISKAEKRFQSYLVSIEGKS